MIICNKPEKKKDLFKHQWKFLKIRDFKSMIHILQIYNFIKNIINIIRIITHKKVFISLEIKQVIL